VALGLMASTDALGLTSVFRALGEHFSHYASMLAFFRSNTWNLELMIKTWLTIAI
jgi:hypothetical protein